MEIKYKQFVIIPKKPKMSTGKIASQVAHATFMAFEKQTEFIKKHLDKGEKFEHSTFNYIYDWKLNGMCVIVLECDDIVQLKGISDYLQSWGVIHHLYIDEGLTEVRMGTPTALATQIIPEKLFWMFETLKLYRG